MRTCICSPCGILGYGFPKNSFERAMAEKPDAIVVDAGSTDAGPHKLGAGVAIVSRMAAKKDLALLMQGARDLNIPLIIGSAGGSGARVHTGMDAFHHPRAMRGNGLAPPHGGYLGGYSKRGHSSGHGGGPSGKDERKRARSHPRNACARPTALWRRWAMEPILAALDQAQLIICGRAYDPRALCRRGRQARARRGAQLPPWQNSGMRRAVLRAREPPRIACLAFWRMIPSPYIPPRPSASAPA